MNYLKNSNQFSLIRPQFPLHIVNKERNKKRFYRLERFFQEEFFEKEKDFEEVNIPTLLKKLKEKVKEKFQKAQQDIENRPIGILDKIINNYFTEAINVNNYNIEELGALISVCS